MHRRKKRDVELHEGTVVEVHGMKATVLAHGSLERVRCRPPRDRTTPAVGDRVKFSFQKGERRIELIEDRERCLWRPKEHGRLLMASNVDKVILVVAPEPRLKLMMVDRVLVAADVHEIDVAIVMNKTDLPSITSAREALAPYQELGYECYGLSALTGEGVERLRGDLSQGLNVVIGQSGVGKSTLLNALVPNANLKR